MKLTLAWVCLLIVSLFVSQPSAAFAESAADKPGAVKHADSGKHEDNHAGAHAKESPIDAMGLRRFDLGIYTIVVFLLLMGILGKFAWGPIMEGLDKREAMFKSAKEEAEKSLAETAKLRAELEDAKNKGAEEVRAMIEEARRDAEALKEKLKVDAAAEITAERERLRREIEVAKDAALADIQTRAIQLATLISSKTVRRNLAEADHRQLLDEALTDLSQNMGKV